MQLRLRGLTAALIVLAAAIPAHAAITFTTHSGSLNPAGQPVSAKLNVLIQGDRLIVRLSNTTTDLMAFEQTLNSLSFSIAKKDANGSLGKTNGQTARFSAAGIRIDHEMSETQWTLRTAGNRFMLRAPGNQRTILPDLHNGGLDKANKSVNTPGAHEFLSGSVVFEILVPGIDLTDQIAEVRFGWASTETGDPQITQDTANNMDTQGYGDKAQFSLPGDVLMGPNNQSADGELLSDPVRSFADIVGSSGGIEHGVGSGGPVTGPATRQGTNGGFLPNPNDLFFGGGPIGDGGGHIFAPEILSTYLEKGFVTVPEPMTLGLLSLGLLGLLARKRRPLN